MIPVLPPRVNKALQQHHFRKTRLQFCQRKIVAPHHYEYFQIHLPPVVNFRSLGQATFSKAKKTMLALACARSCGRVLLTLKEKYTDLCPLTFLLPKVKPPAQKREV